MKAPLFRLVLLAAALPAAAQQTTQPSRRESCLVPAIKCADGAAGFDCNRQAAISLSGPLLTMTEVPLANAKSGVSAVVSDPASMLCALGYYKKIKEVSRKIASERFNALDDVSETHDAVEAFNKLRIAYIAHWIHEHNGATDESALDDAGLAVKADAETESAASNEVGHDGEGGWKTLLAKANPSPTPTKTPLPPGGPIKVYEDDPVVDPAGACWQKYNLRDCGKGNNKNTPPCVNLAKECSALYKKSNSGHIEVYPD